MNKTPTFATRCRVKNGWALLRYRGGTDFSLPLYAEPSGALSFDVAVSGRVEDIELMLPTGDNADVRLPNPNGWDATAKMRFHVTLESRRTWRRRL